MQYKNIALKGKEGKQIALIKYKEKYGVDIDNLKLLNEKLTQNVIQNSDMAYMICEKEENKLNLLGALQITPGAETKNINVEITCLSTDKKEIFLIVDKIIKSLSLYYYDKENILIKLTNAVDLTMMDRSFYKRKPIGKNNILYQAKNPKFFVLNSLVKEMILTEENLVNSKNYWREKLESSSPSYLDEDLKEIRDNYSNLEEIFYNNKCVNWKINHKGKNIKDLYFYDNGALLFKKKVLKDEGLSYELRGSINDDNFYFLTSNMQIENTPSIFNVNTPNVNFTHNKLEDNKSYIYQKRDDDTLVTLNLETVDNSLTNFNITFLVSAKDEKNILESKYHFLINPLKEKYEFKHFDGEKVTDLIPYLKEEDKVLLFNLKKGNLPIEKIDKTIQRLVKIINDYAHKNNLSLVGYECLCSINDVIGIENEAINLLKGIESEVLIPSLKNKVNDYLVSRDMKKIKYVTRSRSLKKTNNLQD